MLKYFATSKFRSEVYSFADLTEGARDFLISLLLLGAALYCALLSKNAARNGEALRGISFSLIAMIIAVGTAIIMVPRLARRVNFSRWMMPFSFSITAEGWVYILVVFLLALAAINSGNNLLFLILAVLLAAIIASGAFARSSLRSVSVGLDVPENVFVGERVALKVSLKNAHRFYPAVSISVEDLGQFQHSNSAGKQRNRRGKREDREADGRVLRHTAYFPLIPPRDSRTELVTQSFPRRGRYHLEGFLISTRFPFGFFKRGERARAEGAILVYPKVHEVSAYFHLLPFQPGKIEGRQAGSGESLYAIRKYQEGESARMVDWKSTAKTGELMAKQFAREEESRFCLILDTLIGPATEEDEERFEKAVELAASLASHFADEGAEFEFLAPEEYVSRGIGSRHLFRVLKSLAVIEGRRESPVSHPDFKKSLEGVIDAGNLAELLSERIFKIILTSRPRGSFPSTIWRSSHVIYFDEI